MRVECESCKQLVVAVFAVDGKRVRMTCPECTRQMEVVAEPVQATLPAKVEGPTCPKCGAARKASADSCATCGLATSRMDAFAVERDADVPAVVKAAWDRVLESWDDQKRHDAVFELAAANSAFAWVGGRYRDEARTREGDTIAPKQVERVRRATEATLFATAAARPTPESTQYKGTMAILGILVIALMLGIVYAIVKSKKGGDEPPPPPPPRSQVR